MNLNLKNSIHVLHPITKILINQMMNKNYSKRFIDKLLDRKILQKEILTFLKIKKNNKLDFHRPQFVKVRMNFKLIAILKKQLTNFSLENKVMR